MGAFSGGIVGPLKKLLNNKGYKTIGAKEIIMPTNYHFKEFDNNKFDKRIKKGLHTARRFAHSLIFNNPGWGRVPVVSDMISKVAFSTKVWNFAKKKFPMIVDDSKCITCGMCYKLCPVYNISEDPVPEFSNHCQYCMRCLSYCPTEAIQIEGKTMFPYKACEANQILKGI